MKFPSSLLSPLPDRAPSSRVQTRTRMAPLFAQSNIGRHDDPFFEHRNGLNITTTRDTSPKKMS